MELSGFEAGARGAWPSEWAGNPACSACAGQPPWGQELHVGLPHLLQVVQFKEFKYLDLKEHTLIGSNALELKERSDGKAAIWYTFLFSVEGKHACIENKLMCWLTTAFQSWLKL